MKHLKNRQEFLSSKLFEAFDSKKLSKILGYIKDQDSKDKFFKLLVEITDSLDFPMSNLSDDYFQYLPYKKALSLTVDRSDLQDCTASSSDSYPDHSVPDNFCQDGKVLRKWGTGVRKAPCLICGGTGKEKNISGIKYLKFWFNQNGEFTCLTGTDGEKISKINQDRKIDHRELRRLPTGTKVRIELLSNDSRGRINTEGTIYQSEGGGTYVIHNNRSHEGGSPGGRDWKRFGEWSWCVNDGNEYRNCFVIEKVTYDTNDPIYLNKSVNIKSDQIVLLDMISHEDLIKLKQSHFSLILDFSKLKTFEFKKKSEIKKERELQKLGATALISDEEIKQKNIKRYLNQVFDRLKVSTDIEDISKLMMKIMGGNYLGFHIFNSDS